MRNSSGTLLGVQGYEPVKIGGMGYVTGISIPNDGTIHGVWTDVGGAYIRENGAASWRQVIDASFPQPTAASLTGLGNSTGVYAMAFAPSDSNIVYMPFRGQMFRSADRGITWADTGLNGGSGLYMQSNDGTCRLVQNKLVVDPSNPEVVYLGTQKNGGWRRLSGVWTQVASLPGAAFTDDGDNIVIFAVDHTSALTGSGATLRHSVVYCSVAGQGIYRSADGGSTFALMSGHPGSGASYNAFFMGFEPDGKLYVAIQGTSDNLWTYNGSAWSNLVIPGVTGIRYLAVDPKDTLRTIGCAGSFGQKPFITTDGGTNWSGFNSTNQRAQAHDAPLAALVYEAEFRASSNPSAAFFMPDPVANRDWVPSGYGVFYFDSPWAAKGDQSLVWHEDTVGIEELVAQAGAITPNGNTVMGVADKGTVRQPASGYPSVTFPFPGLSYCYSVDYAADDPDWVAAYFYQSTGNEGGYSADGGRNWSHFPVDPTNKLSGCLAVGNAGNVVVFPMANGLPRYTTDNGASWAQPTFTGFAHPADGVSNGWGFGGAFYRREIVCSDKDAPGTFYAWNYGATGLVTESKGLWKSTDSGATFNRIATEPGNLALHATYHSKVICSQGVVYIATGPNGSDWNGDASVLSYRYEGGTFTALGEVYEVVGLAAGAPPPGSSTHTLYALAWKGGVYGLYRSFNKGVNWTLLEQSGHFDFAQTLIADPTVFGRVLIGYSGTGFFESNYSYTFRLRAS